MICPEPGSVQHAFWYSVGKNPPKAIHGRMRARRRLYEWCSDAIPGTNLEAVATIGVNSRSVRGRKVCIRKQTS